MKQQLIRRIILLVLIFFMAAPVWAQEAQDLKSADEVAK
jgi:hypothetical protein